MRKSIIVFLISIFYFSLFSQHSINPIVDYSNTGTHGMLVVHRLLEGYNQEINKYVDLDGYTYNYYVNADLPKDIFQDADHWFYPISPREYFNDIQKLNSSQSSLANDMHLLFTQANNIRFEIEQLIKEKDLTNPYNLGEIYVKLESCVDLFDAYYKQCNTLSSSAPSGKEYEKVPSMIKSLLEFYRNSTWVLERLRYERNPDLNEQIRTLEEGLNNLEYISELINKVDDPIKRRATHVSFTKCKTQATAFVDQLKDYQSMTGFDERYKLYGKEYFYHNVQLLSSFNWYGLGFVHHANELLISLGYEEYKMIEIPHYFKVIYPRKIEKIANLPNEITLNQPKAKIEVLQVPSALENRTTSIKQKAVDLKEENLTLSVLDHRTYDQDTISLNLNGEWILENHPLTYKAHKIDITIDPSKENYLILHAVNLGKIPPNTAAIDIYSEGKLQKRVVLNSDLNESEMILLTTKKED